MWSIMCYFLAIGLPPTAEGPLRAEFKRGYMVAYPVTNPSIRAVLPGSYEMAWLISGMCSCGLYVRPTPPPSGPSAEGLRASFRKRGWPQAKIDRAVAQKLKDTPMPDHRPGLNAEVAAKLVAVAQVGGPLALVAHFYNESHDEERFEIAAGPRYPGESFVTAAATIPVDTLVWVEGIGRRGGPVARP